MALKKVDMGEGEFLYRCEFCGYEYPAAPVKEKKLVSPPPHHCQKSEEGATT
jgi:hypothetical protein